MSNALIDGERNLANDNDNGILEDKFVFKSSLMRGGLKAISICLALSLLLLKV